MRLREYVDNLQSRGRICFTKDEALQDLGCTKIALKRAIEELQKKKRLVVIKHIFVLIIPLEYKVWGILPADWFIDKLMQILELPYYVCLLTAAQLHGAAHQKPMQFQVMTNQVLKPIVHGNLAIHFYVNEKISRIPVQKKQCRSGYMNVSTPESTALDLCRYYKNCGYFSNVATVLAELQEVIDPKKLYDLATSNIYELAVLQRLGYLLSLPEVEGANIAQELATIIERKNARWVPLQPGRKITDAAKDPKWRVYINTEIETDDL